MAGGELFVFVAGLVEGELELGGALLGVGDGGLVAVVAVGDDELLVGHGGDDEVDEVGVGELPDAVDYAVFVGDGEVGAVPIVACGFESFISIGVTSAGLAPKMSFSAVKAGSE